jgi:hypothetical protein
MVYPHPGCVLRIRLRPQSELDDSSQRTHRSNSEDVGGPSVWNRWGNRGSRDYVRTSPRLAVSERFGHGDSRKLRAKRVVREEC